MTATPTTTLEGIHARIRRLPIVDHLGLRIQILEDGDSLVTIPTLQRFHLGGIEGEFLNGGIILSMLDAAIASASLRALDGQRCGTAELSAKMLRPVPARGVVARGRVIRRTERLVLATACLLSADGTSLVTATGTVIAVAPE